MATAWNAAAQRPVEHLGDAYIQLRRAVLSNDRVSFVSAWDGFDRVVRVHPDWPYARLGLAMAALEIYGRRYPLPADYDNVAGGTHYDGYTIQIKRTLRAEPDFQPAIDWVVASMSAEGDREQPGAILEALQYIADSTSVSDPRIQLILSRADRLQGDPTQSLQRIANYLRDGGDSGIAHLERARSLAWMGTLDPAMVAYLEGAQVQTGAARDAYRLDIDWVATPRELARFDSLPADSVGAFILHFWNKRDVQELRADGSRLPEHLRRWVYVNQHFRVPDPERRTGWKTAFVPWTGQQCLEEGANTLDNLDYSEPARQGTHRAPERVFDHRAIVYMRHGEPMYRLGGSGDSLSYGPTNRDNKLFEGNYADPPTPTQLSGWDPSLKDVFWTPDATRNVTWVYLIGGQLRVFTFMGHSALGRNSPSTMILYQPPNLDVMLQLAALSSSYSRLAGSTQWNAFSSDNAVPGSCERWYRDVIRQQRSDAAVAVTTDTYLRHFAKPIEASLQISALGQPSAGTGELIAVIAVRTLGLQAEPVPGDSNSVLFRVRLQLAAIDSLTGEAVRADTVRKIVASRALTETNAWITVLTMLRLKPGLKEVRLSVEQDDDRGNVFAADISPAAAGFAVSDMVLGTEHGALTWPRNGVAVRVTAFSTFSVGETVPLYYEAYGLTSGSEYRTSLTLHRTGDAKEASTVSSTVRATSSTLSSTKALVLSGLKPGQYELILTVEELATGRKVTRQRAIAVDKN